MSTAPQVSVRDMTREELVTAWEANETRLAAARAFGDKRNAGRYERNAHVLHLAIGVIDQVDPEGSR